MGAGRAGGTLPCLGFSTLALGSSAVASDAPSLARWGWALFSGKIIDAESLETMTTLSDGEHGLGIDRSSDFPSELAYGHSGSQPGYAALLAIFPERQIVVVMFVNDEKADVNGHAGQSSAHSASDIRAGAREEAPIRPYRRVEPRSGRA